MDSSKEERRRVRPDPPQVCRVSAPSSTRVHRVLIGTQTGNREDEKEERYEKMDQHLK